MGTAIVLVIILGGVILWQRQRLLRAGDAFGAHDDDRPEDDRGPR
jgi:hypothetical protein